MKEKKLKNKRLVIGIISAVVLGFGITVALIFIFGDKLKVSPSPTTPSGSTVSEREDITKKGIEAEKKGDTKEALSSYRDARELCEATDQQCKNDMNAKVELMEAYLKREEKMKNVEKKDVIYDENTPQLGPTLPYESRGE